MILIMIMKSLRMDYSSSFNQQNKHGIMDGQQKGGAVVVVVVDDDNNNVVSSCDDVSSVVSSDSDLFEEDGEEEVNSSGSSSSPTSLSPSSGSSSSSAHLANGSLQDMSSLLQDLPFKKGLSRHYNGKSQSFTSLANVRCLEDLAKPENPYNKRLKSCRSYGLLESYRSSQPHRSASSSRLISKKTSSSRGSCTALLKRNGSFLGNHNRPPIPTPHRSTSTTSFTNQTPPLFA